MTDIRHRPIYFLLGLIVGILLGGVIGVVTALWFAPQSGKQTQRLVRKQGEAFKHRADKAASHVYEQIEDTVAQATDQVETLGHAGEQFLDNQVERVNQATASVKKAVSG